LIKKYSDLCVLRVSAVNSLFASFAFFGRGSAALVSAVNIVSQKSLGSRPEKIFRQAINAHRKFFSAFC